MKTKWITYVFVGHQPLWLAFAAGMFALAQATAADVANGQRIYETSCIACHGPSGQGAIPGVPDLASRLSKSDAELTRNILNGIKTPDSAMAMPAKGGIPNLSAEDAQAIVDYLRKIIKTGPGEKKPVPSDGSRGAATPSATPNASDFARGAQAWADNCARCHAMRDPKSLTDTEWQVVTTHMRLRAGLEGQQTKQIIEFLKASN